MQIRIRAIPNMPAFPFYIAEAAHGNGRNVTRSLSRIEGRSYWCATKEDS